jgi:hypothetical protein
LLPPEALIETSLAMQSGAAKYGAWNWRRAGVRASVYIAAMLRHILVWADGEDVDRESGASHLAHVIACAAILLDAARQNKLVDDRARSGTVAASLDRAAELLRCRAAAQAPAMVGQDVDVPAHHRDDGAEGDQQARLAHPT